MASVDVFKSTPAAVNVPIFLVISVKLYIVLSAYMLSSSNAALTSANVEPLFDVFANMVCIAFICVSYSWKPVLIGSMVNESTIRFPALTALFVIFAMVVAAATCIAENLSWTVSIAFDSGFMLTFLILLLRLSTPLSALPKFKLSLSLPNVRIVSLVFCSKLLLSNSI